MKTKPRKRHVVLSLFLWLMTLGFGLDTAAAEEAKLSLPEATAALSRMVSGEEWDQVPHARPVPPVDQFKVDKAGLYRTGSWTIHLEQRTFVFTLSHKDGGVWERSGTFVLNDQQKWQTKVEREVRSAN